ncbi:MAG: CotH kinase family protein, partial [Planctomycetes bacterium]|nr:CotH kinase family protein [Planctomycetota bacterium]
QHGAASPSPLQQYRLVMDDEAWAELNARPLHSDELLDGSFVFGTSELYYNIGVRFRGSPWQRPGNPRMFRLRFGSDDRFHGNRKINISRYGARQNERTAYYSVWRNSSETSTAPHSHTVNIKFFTNGGLHGIMEQIEPIGSDYLQFWFPNDPDGFLMKITAKLLFDDNYNHIGTAWATYQYQGTDKERYRWNFNPNSRELEDNFQPLIDLTRTMTTGTDQQLDQNLEKILDVEQFFRVLTARTAHDDWDTIGIGNGQNGYLYFAPIEGRWKLLPWDCDNTWGNVDARLFPDADAGTARLVNRPQHRRLHARLVKEMIGGYWNVPEMSKILDPVYAVVGQETGAAEPSGLKNFIAARTLRLQTLIPAPLAFSIRTNSGNDFAANQVSATVEGNGWVDIAAILVNGEPFPVRWTAFSTWSGAVALNLGANHLRFTAFDHLGSLVGSDEITITSTVGWERPQIAALSPGEARAGERIGLTGTNFHTGIQALFGSTRSPNVVFDEAADPAALKAEVAGAPGSTTITVVNVDGRSSDPAAFTILPPYPRFLRGDANLNGGLEIADAVRLLLHLFRGAALGCEDAADADDNEAIEIADAVRLLTYLFADGDAPPAPFPLKGQDPSGAALTCQQGI